MAWEYWEIKEDAVGFSLGMMGADALSVDWGEMRMSGEFLLVAFDLDRKVTSHALSNWDSRGGTGRSIQPFNGFLSVVDSDDLLEDLAHHDWGGFNLLAMPATLNRASSPTSGQSGFEKRGTPKALGQRALEF